MLRSHSQLCPWDWFVDAQTYKVIYYKWHKTSYGHIGNEHKTSHQCSMTSTLSQPKNIDYLNSAEDQFVENLEIELRVDASDFIDTVSVFGSQANVNGPSKLMKYFRWWNTITASIVQILRKCVLLMLCWPASTAEVERLFTVVNNTKTNTRNRLYTPTIHWSTSHWLYVGSNKGKTGG